MRRCFLAVLALLGAVGVASADYVVIMINLRSKEEVKAPKRRGTGPGMGMLGGPGMGMIGGGPGMGMMGGGMGGGMGMRGGMMGGGMGMRGGMMGGGMGGGMGMMGGGMGMMGGGMGMRGGMMGGGMGGMGMMGGGMGMMGGGMGMMGGPGMGMMGGPASGGGTEEEADEDPYLVVAVLEVKSPAVANYAKKFEAGQPLTFHHHLGRGGSIRLATKLGIGQAKLLTAGGKPIPTVRQQYEKEYKEKFGSRDSKPSTSDVLELARWALEHGLLEEFTKLMDGLAESDKTDTAVAAYRKVKAQLARKPSDEDVAGAWKRKMLDRYEITQDDKHHYAILHSRKVSAKQAEAYLDRLEDSLRGFYYWWALRGTALDVPKKRLVAVVTDEDSAYRRLYRQLTAGPDVADGFVARRENLSVFADRRRDAAFRMLEEVSKPLWEKGFKPDLLLAGSRRGGASRAASEEEITEARLYAVMLRAMEHERDVNSATHEASRQLMFATGLLPQKVVVPEWVQFGMGSFFETPLQSPWAGVGAPNAYWLPRFKELFEPKKGKKRPDRFELLRDVVTDGVYRGGSPGEKPETALRKARAASWALAYYLAKNELPGLRRYFKELAKLPRDVQLDDKVLLGCFARAFDCVNADRTVNTAKLRSLANRWVDFMRVTRPEAEGIHKQIRDYYAKAGGKPSSGGTGGTRGGTRPAGGRPVPPGGGGGTNPP